MPIPPDMASPVAMDRRNALFVLATVAVVALILVVLSSMVQVLLLFFISMLLALALLSTAGMVSRYTHLPDNLALALTLLVILILIGGGLVLLAPNLAAQIDELGERIPESLSQLEEMLIQNGVAQEVFDRAPSLHDLLPEVGAFLEGITAIFSSALTLLATLLIVIFISIYLALEPDLYIEGTLRLVPAARRARMRAVLVQIADTLRWWLLSRGLTMLLVGVLVTLGLSIIGIPLALALGVIAALLELIPNIGPIMALIPAVLVALSMGTNQVLYVIVLYFVLQQVESYVITPFIEKQAVRLPPALTVGLQVLLTVIVGPLGLLLAAPLAAAGLVVVRMLYIEDVLGESNAPAVPE